MSYKNISLILYTFSAAVQWWLCRDFTWTRLLHQALLSPWLSPRTTAAGCLSETLRYWFNTFKNQFTYLSPSWHPLCSVDVASLWRVAILTLPISWYWNMESFNVMEKVIIFFGQKNFFKSHNIAIFVFYVLSMCFLPVCLFVCFPVHYSSFAWF